MTTLTPMYPWVPQHKTRSAHPTSQTLSYPDQQGGGREGVVGKRGWAGGEGQKYEQE
jgi:hypothetical protein